MVECLNCGETPESLKRQGITMCAIEGGYEYREIEHEFAHHRWADWRDRELDLMGIRPEAYEKHRRTPALHMQWVGCEDTKRGHVPATEENAWADYGCRVGQCIACGKVPESTAPEYQCGGRVEFTADGKVLHSPPQDHSNGDPCPTCDVGENAPNPACASWVHPGNGPSQNHTNGGL